MTEPVTTANVPTTLKQGRPAVKATPAKQHPVHRAAQAAAARINSNPNRKGK